MASTSAEGCGGGGRDPGPRGDAMGDPPGGRPSGTALARSVAEGTGGGARLGPGCAAAIDAVNGTALDSAAADGIGGGIRDMVQL